MPPPDTARVLPIRLVTHAVGHIGPLLVDRPSILVVLEKGGDASGREVSGTSSRRRTTETTAVSRHTATCEWRRIARKDREENPMTKRSLIVGTVVLALLVGTVGVAYAITNGQPDEGEHPYVALLVFGEDTGDGFVPWWRCSDVEC